MTDNEYRRLILSARAAVLMPLPPCPRMSRKRQNRANVTQDKVTQ